jgi:hypothetical protein
VSEKAKSNTIAARLEASKNLVYDKYEEKFDIFPLLICGENASRSI